MSITERRRMVENIDRKMRQLNNEIEILVQMADYMPDFHHVMTNASRQEMDAFYIEYEGFFRFAKTLETLAFLCREYTGFYHYAMLMEETNESKSKSAYAHLPELPDSIKTIVSELLKEGAAIEQGCQSIIDQQHKRDMWLEIEIIETKLEWWMRSFSELPKQLQKANVPAESCSIMLEILTPMCKRINQLCNQVIAKKR
jgi:hypothetical protein